MKKKGSQKSQSLRRGGGQRNNQRQQQQSSSQHLSNSLLNRSRERSGSSNKDALGHSQINSQYHSQQKVDDISEVHQNEDYLEERHHQKENRMRQNQQRSSITLQQRNGSSQSKKSKKLPINKNNMNNMQKNRASWDQYAGGSEASAPTPQEWMLGSEKVSQQSAIGLKPQEGSAQSMQRMVSQSHKQLQTANCGRVNNTSSDTAALAYQIHGSGAKQLSPLKKQSSLKKFDQRLYQHSYTKVFVMGDTKHGQLGFTNPNENNSNLDEFQRASPIIAVPKLCSYNILVKQIACGEAHTHLLSHDGYVYSMGSNEHGVLGLDKPDHVLKSVTQPQLVPNLQCVIQMATGRAHSIALDVRREVYGWGRSDNGVIGLRMATPEHQSHPMPLNLNLDTKDQVIQIDCGLEHSCFLTADGHVYGCGEGEYGQLGAGYVSLKEYRPVRAKIRDMPPGDYVTQIACGAHHTAYLTRFKHVYMTGANNLGQLGIDSLESQMSTPTLVEYLSDKSVQEVICGDGSFAITSTGELYVWGLYNLQLYRRPHLSTEISRPVTAVSQSFFGVTAAVDADGQAWYWHTQLDAHGQNVMRLEPRPTVTRQMRKRQVKKVFAGKDLVFALGDDVQNNASSSTVKDSQASSGLQEIPERDERQTSGTLTQKMPMLNLAKLHKGSTGSLNRLQQMEKAALEHNRSKSRSKTPSRSRSAKKPAHRSDSRSASKAKNQRAATNSKSPATVQRPPRRHSSSKKQANKKNRGARSASRSGSEAKRPKRVLSRSRSGLSSKALSRSNSVQKTKKMKLAAKAQNASMVSKKQSKSMEGRPVKKRTANTTLEQQVAQKFLDLSQRLETDKTEVVTRLAQLSQKVGRIHKKQNTKKRNGHSSKQMSSQQSAILYQINSPPQKMMFQQNSKASVQLLSKQNSAENVTHQRSASYDLLSEDPRIQASQNAFKPILQEDGVQKQAAQVNQAAQSFDQRKAAENVNIFNPVMQEEVKPSIIYSPQVDTLDIRSPSIDKGLQEQRIMDPRYSAQPQQMQQHPLMEADSRFNHNRNISEQYQQRQGGYTMSPQVRSPEQHTQQIPSGYVGVRSKSPMNRIRSPSNKLPSHEQQVINQLREQIDYLERQTKRLNEEKVQEQIRAQEYANRFDEARQSSLKIDVTQEGTLRSLESQLRTCKLEKSDLEIRNQDAERRVRDLEEKVITQGANKNKEEDYRNQLGKSHENLRLEKNKNKDLQTENEMLQKTLTILETTIEQVKRDKNVVEQDNQRLKESLQARDEQDRAAQVNFLSRRDAETHMTASAVKQSRSAALRKSSQGGSRGRASQGSQRSDTGPASFNLIPTQTAAADCDEIGSGGLMEDGKENEQKHQSELEAIHRAKIDQKDRDQYYTVNIAQNNSVSNPTRGSEFRSRESRETGRFVDPPVQDLREKNDPIYEEAPQQEEQYQSNRDPRIQRLLEDAKELQQKHRLLMSTSPLRLKENSADRTNGVRSSSVTSRNSPAAMRDAVVEQRSRYPDYERFTDQEQQSYLRDSRSRQSRSPLEQSQSGPATTTNIEYQMRNASPLRHKSQHQMAQSHHQQSQLKSQSDYYPNQQLTTVRDDRPATQQEFFEDPRRSIESGIRPYFEPPSLSEGQSGEPTLTAAPTHHPQTATIHEIEPDFEADDEDEPETAAAPVREDFDPSELRNRASLKDNQNPFKRPQSTEPDFPRANFKDSLSQARGDRPQSKDRRPEAAEYQDPPRNLAQQQLTLAPQTKSQGNMPFNPRLSHDNKDYIDQQRRDRQSPVVIRSAEPPSINPVNQEQMEDQYNKKLLDKINQLAEKAKNKVNDTDYHSPKEPRVNKFKRSQGPPSSQKENSYNNSTISPRPQSNQKAQLPAQIFGDSNRDAYENKLRQINRDGVNSVDNRATRAASNGSNVNKNRGRRPLSKEEDDEETRQMLVQPKKGGGQWNSGLPNRRDSVDNEKPTAQNNSFLARREALQNRLKKL